METLILQNIYTDLKLFTVTNLILRTDTHVTS